MEANNTPNTMPHIAEFGSSLYESHKSTTTVLRTETRRVDHGPDAPAEYRYDRPKVWTLRHVTRGYVIAGSCARWQENDVWKVTTMIDGASNGRAFLTLAEAESWLAGRGDLIGQ
jgi:hypothetical protein